VVNKDYCPNNFREEFGYIVAIVVAVIALHLSDGRLDLILLWCFVTGFLLLDLLFHCVSTLVVGLFERLKSAVRKGLL
jgi:hypothetical protein